MTDYLNNTRVVFFVSNSTGITIETLGRSLLYQFTLTEFESHSLRFVDTVEKAKKAVQRINQVTDKSGLRPIILSTLVKPELREILATAEGLYLDVFDMFITSIEKEIGYEAKLSMGRVHGIGNDEFYNERMDAVNFTLKTDDGVGVKTYSQADIILIGASRTGKTPTSLYLALHYGLKAANYPIVDAELDSLSLPRLLNSYQNKLFGLIVTPEQLHRIRTKRRADSTYSSLSQCQYEIRQTEALFQQQNIPYFDVSSMSIEEVSSNIMDNLKLEAGKFML